MSAYYNEIDKNAAQWIRNLIAAGHIAPGEVDERSIEDVCPDDIRGFTQCHFFAGVAVWSYALRQAGWADDRPVWTGSCPCQPFSAAGKGTGFTDERHLWPAFYHLIEQCRPSTVFGEQVASKDGLAWLDLVLGDLDASGYTAGAVDTCAAGHGAPHIRQRLYWVGHDNSARLEGFAGYDSATRRTGRDRSIAASGVSGGVADSQQHDSRSQTEPADWTGGCGVSLGGMADSNDNGCEPWREGSAALGYGQTSWSDSGAGRLADTESDRRTNGSSVVGCSRSASTSPSEVIGAWNICSLGGVDDSKGQRPGFFNTPYIRTANAQIDVFANAGDYEFDEPCGKRIATVSTGPTNGFWQAADWLGCRDGKWRPVEPGTFPLVTGATARVVRLRAYGNSIVAPVAQAFIESVMGYQS